MANNNTHRPITRIELKLLGTTNLQQAENLSKILAALESEEKLIPASLSEDERKNEPYEKWSVSEVAAMSLVNIKRKNAVKYSGHFDTGVAPYISIQIDSKIVKKNYAALLRWSNT